MLKIFVAHPYKAISIDDYRGALKEIERENKNVRFLFADEEITSDFILEKIERMIVEADVSLFDLTSWNPNVALELGLAVGLKRVFYILFNPQHDAAEVPSDIRGKERIEYTSFAQLRSKVSLVVAKHLSTQSEDVGREYESLKSKVFEYIAKNGPIGINSIEEGLSLKKAIISPVITELKETGQVEMIGNKKGAKYRACEKAGG